MKRILGLLAFLLLVSPSGYVAWKSRDMPQFGHLHDDAIYFVSAKSIAEGHGYRILSLPGEPYQTKYPPLFPMLLALVWKVRPDFPGNLPLATFVCWLMLPVFLGLSWLFYVRLGLPRWHCWLLIGLLALNLWVLEFSVSLMPELMFSAFLIASVIAADRASDNSSSWSAFAAAILASAAYLAKTAALPILFSAPLVFLLRKQVRCAVVFFASMSLAVIGWNVWVYTHLLHVIDENELYYVSYFGYRAHTVLWGDLPMIVEANARALVLAVAGLVSPHKNTSPLGDIIQVLVTATAVTGMFWMLQKFRSSQYFAFAACFLPALLLWHFAPNERFVLPLIPLLVGGCFLIVQDLIKGIAVLFRRRSTKSLLAALALSLVVSAFLAPILLSYGGAPWSFISDEVDPSRVELRSRIPDYKFIAKNIPAQSAFLAHEDPSFYLYTGHHARSLHAPPNLLYRDDRRGIAELYDSLPQFAHEHHLDYVFITPNDFYRESHPDDIRSTVRRVVQENGDFEILHQDDAGSIYRVKNSSILPVGTEIPTQRTLRLLK